MKIEKNYKLLLGGKAGEASIVYADFWIFKKCREGTLEWGSDSFLLFRSLESKKV